MESTINYGLRKPSESDYYNVEDFNNNVDVIDYKLNDIENRSFGTNSIKFYVNANTGSDDNDGTSMQPFKTITKAVKSVNEYSGYHEINVYIAEGTYTESFSLLNFAGYCSLIGASKTGTIINGNVTFGRCSHCLVMDLTINAQGTGNNGIYARACKLVEVFNVVINHTSKGVGLGRGLLCSASNVTANNVIITGASRAIESNSLGTVYAMYCVISNADIIAVLESGDIRLVNCTKSNYGVLNSIQNAGVIFMNNTYLDIKNTSVVN